MAATATLVGAGHNRLRYLVTDNGGGGTATITSTGAATPDLNTDSLAGPIKDCSRAFTDGLGKLAAGAKTQAQSRAIWMGQDSDSVLGNGKVPRCVPRATSRVGTTPLIDANVDGGGHPTITIVMPANGEAYVEIETQGAIGL